MKQPETELISINSSELLLGHDIIDEVDSVHDITQHRPKGWQILNVYHNGEIIHPLNFNFDYLLKKNDELNERLLALEIKLDSLIK